MSKLLKHYNATNTIEVCFGIDLASRMQLDAGRCTFIKFENGAFWVLKRAGTNEWVWGDVQRNYDCKAVTEFMDHGT